MADTTTTTTTKLENEKTIGTSLSVGDPGETVTYTKIANLTSIGEIGVESEEIEVTDLDTTGGYKQFNAGAKDAGEVALAGNIKSWDDFESLLGYAESQSVIAWKVEYPSGATWTFNGFVKSFKDGEKTPESLATFTATIRVSGKPTFAKPTT